MAEKLPGARLLLVGTGPQEAVDAAHALAAELQLTDRVIFAGVRSDLPALYAAMDAFLLPSLFEGLPVVLVEAQAAGLPCFVADSVDRGAAFGPGCHFLPITEPGAWVQALTEAPLTRDPDAQRHAVAAGYDIHHSAAVLEEFYLRKAAEVTR